MNNKGNTQQLVVGLFGVIALLIVVFMSREVIDTPGIKGKPKTLFAYFDSVSGLIPKTPIEIAGIQIGFVDSIDLENGQAKLVLKVNGDTPIYSDAEVRIRSRGILGDKFISIDPGSTNTKPLGDNEAINKTRSGGEMEALFETLNQSAVQIRELSQSLNTLVSNNTATMENILDNVERLTGSLSHLSGENGDFRMLVSNLKELSESLQSFVDTSLNENVTETSRKLNETVSSIQKVVDKVERGEGTVGKLLNDETTVNRLNSALEGVESITGGLNRLQVHVRYRGEYLTDSRDLQNQIGFTLQPRPDKFFRFEVINAPTSNTRVTNTSIESPPGTVLSNSRTIETSNNVVFSLEMAKRFYDLTVHFGLIRNLGGVGVDYHLLDDMLTLSVEGFDFSRLNNRFHLRSFASLNLWKHLILTGGFDDLLNETGDVNAFLGAGITFQDDDVKSLFGAVSAGSRL